MPPRLQHKKSRAGCQRCKARKVKCDEARPSCRDCRRHNVPCEYPPTTNSSHYTSKTKQANHKIAKGDDINSLPPDDRRLLELQLLHHYTSVVSMTIPSSDDETTFKLYKKHAVQLSFHHPVLLNAILALSALHMISSPRIKSPSYVFGPREISEHVAENHPLNSIRPQNLLTGPTDARTAHRIYLNLAIKQQREEVENLSLNSSSTNGLMIASVFLAYQALGFWNLEAAQEEDEEQEAVNDTYYGPPIHWLRMVKGISAMADALNPSGEEPFLQYMSRKANKPDFGDRATLFHPNNALPFGNLLDFELYPEMEEVDLATESTYRLTLAYIGGIHRGIEEQETPSMLFRRILGMALMVPATFLDYIEQQRPRALAMLALYCVTMSVFDGHWMYHGMAEREVRGLATLLPNDWKWSMEVPIKILAEGKYKALFESYQQNGA